ncbi:MULTISPECIES: hypothetical protein [Mesorhizobium]|uniref:hypothetical protein n=1 Tax=Mesorhizobium TaxID=68287 RepID=UPI001483CD82|nr:MULTISPECIES: hypothetical protein [Mesorhizobium]
MANTLLVETGAGICDYDNAYRAGANVFAKSDTINKVSRSRSRMNGAACQTGVR